MWPNTYILQNSAAVAKLKSEAIEGLSNMQSSGSRRLPDGCLLAMRNRLRFSSIAVVSPLTLPAPSFRSSASCFLFSTKPIWYHFH